MPSAAYADLLRTVSAFVPAEKALGIVGRQVPKCNQTAETLNKAGLKAIRVYVMGAAGLYIPEAGRRQDLEDKLAALE